MAHIHKKIKVMKYNHGVTPYDFMSLSLRMYEYQESPPCMQNRAIGGDEIARKTN